MAIQTQIAGTTVHVGDTVSVFYKIIEKEVVTGKTKKEKHEEQKERVQAFTGTVLAIKGGGQNQSFCVRHMGVGNIGVERIFPVVSPWIKKVVILKKGHFKRAKLYFLRNKSKKDIAKMEKREEVVQVVPTAKETPKPAPKTETEATHAPQQPSKG